MDTAATKDRPTLLDRPSIEITAKDSEALVAAAPRLTPGTSVNVTYLGGEDTVARVAASAVTRQLGFRPVPHLSARRITAEVELVTALSSLEQVDAAEEVFVVGGDPTTPHGPYADALALLDTGLLPSYGVRRVGITGYPEGHPHIFPTPLWSALEAKVASAAAQNLEVSITTQFGFDAAAVAEWIAEVRRRGITAPVRVGVPGPASVRRLLGYARRFGVKSSAGIVGKYGISLANFVGSAGPDRFLDSLEELLTPEHGRVAVHLYTFGGIEATASWMAARQGART
jgi:methylenetetrahydrofolate reductase (NADPH)